MDPDLKTLQEALIGAAKAKPGRALTMTDLLALAKDRGWPEGPVIGVAHSALQFTLTEIATGRNVPFEESVPYFRALNNGDEAAKEWCRGVLVTFVVREP